MFTRLLCIFLFYCLSLNFSVIKGLHSSLWCNKNSFEHFSVPSLTEGTANHCFHYQWICRVSQWIITCVFKQVQTVQSQKESFTFLWHKTEKITRRWRNVWYFCTKINFHQSQESPQFKYLQKRAKFSSDISDVTSPTNWLHHIFKTCPVMTCVVHRDRVKKVLCRAATYVKLWIRT